MIDLTIYTAAWVAYFVLHSLLASNAIKNKLGRPTWYRLFYTLVSLATLLPIFWYRLCISSNMLFTTSLASKLPAVGLGYAAFVVFKQSAKLYDLKAFVGLKQNGNNTLKTSGILAKMRHPFYTATILLGIGFWLWTPTDTNLAMVLTWFAYLPIGIWLEEKKLLKEFGPAYAEYKKKVPAIFPKVGFLAK